jgi:hypothetical protein
VAVKLSDNNFDCFTGVGNAAISVKLFLVWAGGFENTVEAMKLTQRLQRTPVTVFYEVL